MILNDLKPDVIAGAWRMPMIPEEFFEQHPTFRYLCYFCGSVRGKISRGFIEKGGLVTNWGDLAAKSVAECALTLALGSLRRTSRYALEMHVDRSWLGLGNPPPLSLAGRKVGIHGFGAVARALLPMLAPFTNKISVWSEGVPPEMIARHGVRQAKGLEALFSENEVVIEAEALNEKTAGSVSWDILRRMPSGGVFVNVGRGAVLAPGAIDSLAARGDVAIGLDVYDHEPLPASSPLRGARHVTLLPHTAGPTVDHYPLIREKALGFIADFLQGVRPAEAMTVEVYDRQT